MGIEIIDGNIFNTKCQTVVNTINCVGVMGAGIALEFRLRYPGMCDKYVQLCENKQIDIGKLWLYKMKERWVLNFPTKRHWKYPTKREYLHSGLQKFCESWQAKGVQSIAFPLLGAHNGGLSPNESLEIMEKYLNDLPLQIEIYRYDPNAKDDLFDEVRERLLELKISDISQRTKIKPLYIDRVMEALRNPQICQLNQLGRVKGVGIKTLEKLFLFAVEKNDHNNEVQGEFNF